MHSDQAIYRAGHGGSGGGHKRNNGRGGHRNNSGGHWGHGQGRDSNSNRGSGGHWGHGPGRDSNSGHGSGGGQSNRSNSSGGHWGHGQGRDNNRDSGGSYRGRGRGRGRGRDRGSRGGRGGRGKQRGSRYSPYEKQGGGDLDMHDSSRNGYQPKRGGVQGRVSYRMNGLPNDVEYKELLQWIKQCVSDTSFRFVKLDPANKLLVVEHHDRELVMQTIHGQMFRQSIQIALEVQKGGAPVSTNIKLNRNECRQLEGMLSRSYQADQKTLLFEAQTTPVEAGDGMSFDNKMFVSELCRIIKRNCREVVTISFARNGISSLEHLGSFLRMAAPNLENLSLANNNISSVEDMKALKGIKLKQLIMTSNPMFNTQDPYVISHAIKSIFPELTLLDEEPVTPVISFNVPGATASDLPAHQPSYFDKTTSRDLCSSFINAYYAQYDKGDRQGLVGAYSKDSTFSLSLPKSVLLGSMDNSYFDANRNMATPTQTHTTLEARLARGSVNVVHQLCQLPDTKHIPSEFTADGFQLPVHTNPASVGFQGGVLQLTIRGTFLEVISNRIRPFHRVFLLTQAATGSEFPALILNDQLFIGGSSKLNPDLLSGLEDLQRAMVQDFSQRGGVDLQTALKALSGCNWNYDMAAAAVSGSLGV